MNFFFVQILKKLHPWMCIVVDSKGRGGDNKSINSTKTESTEGCEPA